MKEEIDNLDKLRFKLIQYAQLMGSETCGIIARDFKTVIDKLREYEFETILKQNSDDNN